MGNCFEGQRGPGDLVDFQQQSPQSTRIVPSTAQKSQAQEASLAQWGIPD